MSEKGNFNEKSKENIEDDLSDSNEALVLKEKISEKDLSRSMAKNKFEEEREIEKTKEKLKVHEIAKEFKEDFENGLADIYFHGKIVQGKEVMGTASIQQGSLELDQEVLQERIKLKSSSQDRRKVGNKSRVYFLNSQYGVFITIDPLLIQEEKSRDSENVGTIRRIFQSMGLPMKQERYSQVRAGSLEDFTELADYEKEEKILKMNIHYFLDNNHYKEDRKMSGELELAIKSSLLEKVLEAVKKSPESLWEILNLIVPGILDAAPPLLEKDKLLGIYDDRKNTNYFYRDGFVDKLDKSKLESLSWSKKEE